MKLEALFDKLHTLPTVPKVAQDLIRQFDDPQTDIDTLAHSIERDPVIAAKVLRLANSARFHGLRDSTSVEDAAMRLGFNTLRTLVLASAMTGAFRAGPSSISRRSGGTVSRSPASAACWRVSMGWTRRPPSPAG